MLSRSVDIVCSFAQHFSCIPSFVLFINDLSETVQDCSVGLYADNIILYAPHSDTARLSEIIEGDILTWIKSNGLEMKRS